MELKALVIVPIAKHWNMLGTSAPMCWMFTKYSVKEVLGIYAFNLTRDDILSTDKFIIELNWQTEIYEVQELCKQIKSINNNAKILVGGITAAIRIEELFKEIDFDYFIQGDNELPIQQFIDGIEPEKTSNMMGRSFKNKISYIFKEEDFYNLRLSLEWFPSYKYYINEFGYSDESSFRNPIIITAKSGCLCQHNGCEYCYGFYPEEIVKNFSRLPIKMPNKALINILKDCEKKFKKITIYANSDFDYDLGDNFFNIEVKMEIDSYVQPQVLKKFMYSFKGCISFLSIHEEGIMGKKIINNIDDFMLINSNNYTVTFAAYKHEEFDEIFKHHIKTKLNNGFAPRWAYFSKYKKQPIEELIDMSKKSINLAISELKRRQIKIKNILYDKEYLI